MKILKRSLFYALMLLLTLSNIQCKNEKKEESETTIPVKEKLTIDKEIFGTMPDGQEVEKFTLKNHNGVEMQVITYGGRITSLKVPNKQGAFENVILGFDKLEDYLADNPFFGALIGRYGNRIAKGKFTLDDKEYTLATNDGPNHLHGGVDGFDRVVWKAEAIEGEEDSTLRLNYLSKNGEEGYPGDLNVTVTYVLTKDNELKVSYKATTNKTTVVNLTQHSYFNLSGDFSKSILDHEVVLDADAFLPVDATLIPTGEIRSVEGTPFDFRTVKTIGKDIEADNEQLTLGKGYDHCWILNGEAGSLRKVGSAFDATSGRFMEVFTDEPGMQFYTGNFLDGTLPMPNGGTYGHRTGFCLETQHYPDSPNQPEFPSTVLQPKETYTTTTIYKFSTK
ncbi:aldose epimerase family protein [Mangrovimonas xylaniphaga]|uniref:aldose epimerase family protein n=1 Tax=Mangrovimonas xylaniphaga TaxID=1645915 RepID=UPI0006B4899E|nr:aldose epimerase family protein [Mangrovimonas xylaniphaga]